MSVLSQLEKYNLNPEQVKKYLELNKHNSATTT